MPKLSFNAEAQRRKRILSFKMNTRVWQGPLPPSNQFFAAKERKELKENPSLSLYQYLSKSSQAVTISRSGQLDL